ALSVGEEWNCELRQFRRDGQEIIVQCRRTLVYDEVGRARAQFWINTDLTGTRTLEQLLRRAQRLESLGALAGGIAHDLNNMLTPIMLGVGLLRPYVNQPLAESMLDTIRASALCCAGLVKQILDFVRGRGGEPCELNLSPLLNEASKLLRKIFPRAITI